MAPPRGTAPFVGWPEETAAVAITHGMRAPCRHEDACRPGGGLDYVTGKNAWRNRAIVNTEEARCSTLRSSLMSRGHQPGEERILCMLQYDRRAEPDALATDARTTMEEGGIGGSDHAGRGVVTGSPRENCCTMLPSFGRKRVRRNDGGSPDAITRRAELVEADRRSAWRGLRIREERRDVAVCLPVVKYLLSAAFLGTNSSWRISECPYAPSRLCFPRRF